LPAVTPEVWLLLAAGVLVLLTLWTAWTLTRLQRLETRVADAWSTLDTQLQRRAGLAEALAREHADVVGDARAQRLATAVAETRALREGDREIAENALGRVLRELPADLPGVPQALLRDLAGTSTRMGLARRFYNDAVRDTRTLRRRRLPRLLRLRASRPLPGFFDIEDGLDHDLSQAGRRSG
jgi:hypothetical protein